MVAKYEKNSLWKHSVLYHEGELKREELVMAVIEKHRSPLNRQIHEGVELEMNGAGVILNSKSECNHSKIPRIVIEVGAEREEDLESGMIRSTELGGRERGNKRMKINCAVKRGNDETENREIDSRGRERKDRKVGRGK